MIICYNYYTYYFMRARNAYAGERMRVFYTDVVAIFDEGVGNSTLSLALNEIISEGTVKVQKTGEPRSVVFYDGEDGKQHAYISNLSGRALFSRFEKHGFIFI